MVKLVNTKNPADRIKVIDYAIDLMKSGVPAVAAWVKSAHHFGVNRSTAYRWFQKVDGSPRDLWESRLKPSYDKSNKNAVRAECSPRAYTFFKKQVSKLYSYNAAYRVLQESAKERGWTIPSINTLIRKMNAEGIKKPTRYDKF